MRPLLAAAITCFLLASPESAAADEIAPELVTQELRQKAGAELRRITSGLSDADRRRLVGVYPAFVPDVKDAVAMAACDDDGDYVVVLSDGMLRLADDVAHATAIDEANGTHKVEEYAAFFAASQVPGKRLLPPPAGTYSADVDPAMHDERLRETLAFVVAREIAHMRAGDLVCPRPTATHEHGDDVWTDAEQHAADAASKVIYASPTRGVQRDAEAAERTVSAGRGLAGAAALLAWCKRVEAEPPRFATSYLRLHPRASERAEAVKNVRER